MNIHYTKTDPHELLKWVTWETQCLLDLRRENQAEIDSAQNTPEALESPDALPQWMDAGIALYRQCIPLIGKAWGIKSEAEAALLGLRESAPTTKDEEDTWTPVDEQLMKLLWGALRDLHTAGTEKQPQEDLPARAGDHRLPWARHPVRALCADRQAAKCAGIAGCTGPGGPRASGPVRFRDRREPVRKGHIPGRRGVADPRRRYKVMAGHDCERAGSSRSGLHKS